ncbi:sialate O-acetylesterase [Lacibacter sp. H375]|uniref:sialate O-acetylesterase n=1 Tax=Lacibacter sp. H375 TaxID=3133424 RepID=UPI0030BAA458
MSKYFLLAASIFIASLSFSQTRLPAMFSDNMVLQQQQLVSVWGIDKPNTKISVKGSWGNNSTATTDATGHWKLKLQTPKAGGPYTLEVKGSKTVTLKNVLIGEVWFCSGQSNMEMPLKGYMNQPVIGSNETILNSANDKIHFINTPHGSSLTALYDLKTEWNVASPATAGSSSAAAYFFAKKLHAVLGVPIGVIHCSWGGSKIESWMDEESLAGFKNNKVPDTLPAREPQIIPTLMYNSLLHPYIGYTIKGVIWYQGESNRVNADEYLGLFTSMIKLWRTKWQQGDFPFYYVQIAPHETRNLNAAYLREAQFQTMLSVPNTGMAVTMDIGEPNLIHPSQKEQVGNRLAYWALVKDYHIAGISCSGPVFKKAEKTEDSKMILAFDYAEMGLTGFGKPLTDFEIAGEDKIFFPAQVKIVNDKRGNLLVWNDDIKKPVAVRYAFKSWVQGSLFNTQGLPASSFRTDNW